MANREKQPIPNLFTEEDAKRTVTDTPSWENTLGFLAELTYPVDAISTTPPVDPKNWLPPIRPWDNAKRYIKRFEISSRYASQNESMDEAGQKCGVTRERVRQVFKETLEVLHNNAPLGLREKYPLESFLTDKRSSIEARMRRSRKMDGKSYRVAEARAAGKSATEIREEFGNIGSSRRTLKGWGIELPYIKGPIFTSFLELRNTALTSKEVQALLDKVNNHHRYLSLHAAGLIANLSSVAKHAGLYFDGRDIYRVYAELNQEKIPIGRVPLKKRGQDGKKKVFGWYNFIAAMHTKKAVAILKSSPELADLRINPVKVIAGPRRGRIPNTTELFALKDYGHVGILIGEIRGMRVSGRKTSDILKESPVRVYRNRRSIFYAKAEREKLADFLSRRLAQLGLGRQ